MKTAKNKRLPSKIASGNGKAKSIGIQRSAVETDRKPTIFNRVSDAAGEDVVPVVKFLQGKKNISEFVIAEKTNLEVNRVRNMLYRLHERNLVTYYRKKDRIKGWYISYWTFNPKGLEHYEVISRKQKLELLRERLLKEEQNKNNFYLCPNLCTRLDFEAATEAEFRCTECGSIVHLQDNSKTIEQIKEKIDQLQKGPARIAVSA